MNREVKFRGKGFGAWRYGYYVHFDTAPTANSETYNTKYRDFIVGMGKFGVYHLPVDLDTVGRYIGLLDKNGKEIFEGDIISDGDNILGYIVFSLRYGISVKKTNTTWSLVNFCLDSDFDSGMLSNIKVVGNIHDNPELIK